MIISTSSSLIAFTGDSKRIEWKSPLKKDDFYQFRDDFLEVLELDENFIKIEKEKLKYYDI